MTHFVMAKNSETFVLQVSLLTGTIAGEVKNVKNTLYIKNLDDLRSFLELASYGCYSRRQMKQIMEKSGTYDKRIEFLNTCLSPDYWHYTQQGKERRFSFRSNAYHHRGNDLLPIFFMKAVDLQWLLCYVVILQTLQQPALREEGIAYSRLEELVLDRLYARFMPYIEGMPFACRHDWQQAFAASPLADDDIAEMALRFYHESWNSQIRRRTKELADMGYVVEYRSGKDLCYRLAPVLDVSLSPSDALRLGHVLSLYQCVSALSLPAYDWQRALQLAAPQYYHIHHAGSLGICNDPQKYILLKAKQHHVMVSFHYKGQPKLGYVLAIYSDIYQREYVLIQEQTTCAHYRIHRIEDLSLAPAAITIKKAYRHRTHHIVIQLHTDSEDDTRRIITQLQHLSMALHEIAPHRYDLATPDGMALIPQLRLLHPAIEIVADTTGNLRDRMKKDIEEALANYDA